MLGTAHKAMKGLQNEVAYTRKALKAIYDNMEKALKHIEHERIEEPAALIEKARVCFEEKNFKEGIALLKESKEQAEKKQLLKTRTALFCGITDEVKDLKHEMEETKNTSASPKTRRRKKKALQEAAEAEKNLIVDGKVFRLGKHASPEAIAAIESGPIATIEAEGL
jgi:hypothetical protein